MTSNSCMHHESDLIFSLLYSVNCIMCFICCIVFFAGRYIIRPRILCDVSSVNLSTTILGNHISFPVCVSPTGMQCAAHSMGEKATAKGIMARHHNRKLVDRLHPL